MIVNKRKTKVPLEVLMDVYPTIGIQSKNKKAAKRLFKKIKGKTINKYY